MRDHMASIREQLASVFRKRGGGRFQPGELQPVRLVLNWCGWLLHLRVQCLWRAKGIAFPFASQFIITVEATGSWARAPGHSTARRSIGIWTEAQLNWLRTSKLTTRY